MWRTANRGVIVGILLLVLLVIYVLVDYSNFKGETDDIKTVVTDYVKEYMDSLNVPVDIENTKNWTKELADSKADTYKQLLDKYFTYTYTKGDIFEEESDITREEADDFISETYDLANLKGRGFVTESTYSTNRMKVEKYGPNGALVTFNLENSLKTTGSPVFPLIDFVPCDDYNEYDEEGEIVASTKLQSVSISSSITVKLTRESGTWKISKISSSDTSSSIDMGGLE